MEHFAVDLDAVLDEFELNEDQAEVAAARLQKQIEQGRLEIASSDATPASSYTDSPRLSLTAGEHGHVTSLATRKSSLADTALSTNSQPVLTNQLAAPAAGKAVGLMDETAARRNSVDNHASSHSVSGGVGVQNSSTDAFPVTADRSLPSISICADTVFQPLASVEAPSCDEPRSLSSVTQITLEPDSSSVAPETQRTEDAALIDGELDSQPETAVQVDAAPAYAGSSNGTGIPTGDYVVSRVPAIAAVNGEADIPHSSPEAPAELRKKQPVALAARIAPTNPAAEEAIEFSCVVPDANASVTGTVDSMSSRIMRESSAEMSHSSVAPVGDVVVACSSEEFSADSVKSGPASVGGTISKTANAPSLEAKTLTVQSEVVEETEPAASADAVIPQQLNKSTERDTDSAIPDSCPSETEPPVEEVGTDACAVESTETKHEPHSPDDFRTPPQDSPAPDASASSEPAVEPVKFQPADDLSDSELDSYLEQLAGEDLDDDSGGAAAPERTGEAFVSSELSEKPVLRSGTDAASDAAEDSRDQEVDNEASFGGARPKISPVATVGEVTTPSPPPAAAAATATAVETAKGGVISRLQSQVSIECVVDSSGANGASHAPPAEKEHPPSTTGTNNTTQAVRPSSLSLNTTPTANSPTDPSDTDPAEEASDPDAVTDSVSTTGGNIVTAPGAYEEARLAAARPAAAPGRGQLVSVSDEDKNLGKVAPVWVPDEDAAACMECEQKFTVIRRRHHCRACGRVLCSACCSQRASLDYMELREGRVCGRCKTAMERVQQDVRVLTAGSASPVQQRDRPPNPNNPMEYCSTVPPTQQAVPSRPPPTVMVPTGVLKRGEGSGSRTPSRESKQVMFSDGIRPGGDLSEPPQSPSTGPGPSLVRPPHRRTARLSRGDKSPVAVLKEARGCKDLAWRPDSGRLPPVYQTGSSGPTAVKQSTPEETIVAMIRAERHLPWSFLINKNLMVIVKIFKLDCCVGRTCWMFSSHGLSIVGQEEVLVVLEALPDENTIPRDVFLFYHHLFSEAAKGNFVTELGHTLFSVPFLGSKEHGGFLLVRPTFQCLHNIPSPPQPFLVAVLIQKWEAPWAKVFPLRLLLRLGAEFRYYPCPLVSVRHRKPVFFEVGHTIINLLADFRNFAYVLPTVHGMHIHMEEQQTSVLIPRNRFNQVLKAINNSNDHVLALGASFSREADSHLVCLQNEDGQYQTQAINIQNRPRQVTGASFIVFNGALKSASGVTAKSSIVEDGLMFQISPDTMQALRAGLRQMQDFTIQCGTVGQPPDETVNIRWVQDDLSHNLGVRSVIDDRPLDGVRSIRVHSGTDYVTESKLIRWTELYLIKVSEGGVRVDTEPPFSRLAEQAARGTCVALAPHLPLLAESDRTRVALRITIDSEAVGYEAGSGGEPLPPACMQLLDSELVPVLHRHAADVPDSPICLELLFHVIDR